MVKVNFRGLGAVTSEPARTIVEPRDLFNALPDKETGLDYLRGPQDQVLTAWHARRQDRDIVIKMNTGGGKTLVGFLIARSWLNEGLGPVAYLVPDGFLVAQVMREAERLGIECVSTPEEPAYQRGQAVLVGTFAKLFNGLSVFGVQGNVFKAPRFGLSGVVIDDAHACVARADEAFRLRIAVDTHPEAYEALLRLFRDDIRQQSRSGLLDLEAGRRAAIEEVPFWSWQDKQDRVLDLLHPLSNQEPLKFAWPLLADCLPLCSAVITGDAVEIQPPVHPTDLLTGFHQAKRRVYLTATLADDSVLVRHFAADPKSVAKPIFPSSAGDIGDRMILVPQSLVPSATEEDLRNYVASLATGRNVAVIVPSRARADWWKAVAKSTLDRTNIQAGVKKLRADPTFGLVVFINRYDGIDLPGDACRILVLDGLPEALDGIERLEQAQLRGSLTMLSRQVQRLEQGMGRATRSNEDHTVVLLLGTRLTERLNNPQARDLFSPATRAQLALADAVASQIATDSLDGLTDVIDQCLNRDRDWVALSRGVLAEVRYDAPVIGDEAEAERLAFEAARRGDSATAETQQKAAIKALRGKDENRRALLTQRLAGYTNGVNPTKAQSLQKKANSANHSLLRPLGGIQYERLAKAAAQEQGEQACTWLLNRYSSGNELVIGFNALIQDLDWGPRTKQFEQAMADLGRHIGVMSQRPDEDFNEGPDDLWALPGGDFLVIEAKSGADDGHPVKKDDAKQLSNSMDWFRERYPNSTGTPVIVHPDARFAKAAAIPTGCRVIDTMHLHTLRQVLTAVAPQLATNDAYRDPKQVMSVLADGRLRVSAEPSANTFLARFTAKGRR
ncbi:DEAD/DEAH box helicase [Micropruina sp.]|uniref:DEAD/DEAH box helicase n=1 Tax=Micropruina sp. TaxID=2737536 RepID=UPI0039E59941